MNSWGSVEKQLVEFLDRGSWKNSWHLPKTKHGTIDWWNDETISRIEEEVKIALSEAARITTMAKIAQQWVKKARGDC